MSEALTIGALALADLPAVLEIEQRSHSHPWTRRNFEDAFAAGYGAYGVWREGVLIAFAWVMRPVAEEAELLDIAVVPEARRRGVARRLLEAIEARLRESGCVRLHLEVRASNLPARRLYTLLGYEEVGVRIGYYPVGRSREDAILMRKELAHAHAR